MAKATRIENTRKRILAPFTFAKATHAHQDHLERNEDYLLVDRQQGLAVICDGVGSTIGASQAAQVAAYTIKSSLRHMLAQYTETAPYTILHFRTEQVTQSLEDAQQAVRDLGKRLEENREILLHSAETTVALVLLIQDSSDCHMIYAHIGDSRIYLLRKDGVLQRLTVDDGYFLWKVNKGEMNEQDAHRIEQANSADQLSEQDREHYERRNGIMQALGYDKITPHVDQIELFSGDRVLLCTDGIHDNLTDVEIEEILRRGARTTVANLLVQPCCGTFSAG